jgi:hypothetical protein
LRRETSSITVSTPSRPVHW